MLERVRKILATGANVILTTKGIDDLCLKEFVQAGAMAVRRCKKEDLRRIERGVSNCLGHADSLWEDFKDLRRRVRALHQEIYYRPLLAFAAALSADEMALSPQAARERLAAVGYADPDGALRHIQALTEGVSRRAAIQRQLLPVNQGRLLWHQPVAA